MVWRTINRKTRSGNSINMNLAPNPSHLETVGAIVQGITRAKIDNNYDLSNISGETRRVGAYAPMPPVFGPVSPSPTFL